MRLSNVVRPGVGQFISKEHALDMLDEKIKIFNNPIIITGEKSYAAFKKFYKGAHEFEVYKYDGSASHEDMQRLADEISSKADVILAIGGGRVLDTSKGVSELLNIEYITIPTVLGTCAGYTPLSAVYTKEHTFKQVDYYERAAYACIMDLNLLIESPQDFFQAGIGDTLAKWYEAQGIVEHIKTQLPAMVEIALRSAKITQEVLLRDTKEALQNMKDKKITAQFQRVAETIVAVAGCVGGFGGEYGRMAGAHAIHNGMSLVNETHDFEHGIKVAYGILVQLCAAKKYEEVKKLIAYYDENNFPRKLEQFNITEDVENKMQQIAQFAASDVETFNLAVPNCTTKSVCEAMIELENM